jgi:hypothetical protein
MATETTHNRVGRQIGGMQAYGWSREPVRRLAKALEGLDLLAATCVAVKLCELLGRYALDELEKEIFEAKGRHD